MRWISASDYGLPTYQPLRHLLGLKQKNLNLPLNPTLNPGAVIIPIRAEHSSSWHNVRSVCCFKTETVLTVIILTGYYEVQAASWICCVFLLDKPSPGAKLNSTKGDASHARKGEKCSNSPSGLEKQFAASKAHMKM